ncbi:sigma 54-interacting transcriptional regulator [Succinivibrio dextrinosolvens]|uniref:Transcriptional regulator containing PAS, AAA-type ATPase, and DNA-binding Fis domains n=1 Tax=Succinivibrio dextrinosolvens TaxID=83771 RepID=A0A662ZC65_9GAMM|nr:sigma 54-interacting transcriptional regulator [Succinivibrio dextrinosolvens]SFK26849.1 Transcriptional regulator containing PAS, AAA-type ATPase, and DNA-binding Fis domains [Succinivibrio dextrinosolvens]
MTKIAFILPDNKLIKRSQEICRELKMEDQVEFFRNDIDDAIALAKELDRNDSVDAIISRYGIAHMLMQEKLNVPVIEIMVTGQDLAQAFYEAKIRTGVKHPKITYLAFSNMSNDIQRLSRIMGIELEILELESPEDIKRIIDAIPRKSTDILMGGATSMAYGSKKGFITQIVESGDCALREAFKSAQKVILAKRNERRHTEEFMTLVNSVREGVIYISCDLRIQYVNSQAEVLFNLKCEDIKGKELQNIFSDKTSLEELNNALINCKNKQECYQDILLEINSKLIAFGIEPVIVNSKVVSMVITLMDVTRIQETEIKVRNEVIKNKFLAKYRFESLVGSSPEITETKRLAREFAAVDTTVLITGESGTGKELFAQSIHNASSRRNGPFVAVNCAALPVNLLESELFGYVEGAFTGAKHKGKAGLFEMAHHGTIFLDEISEMEMYAQSRLLRVIQERQVMRLGDDKYIPVDVRIIVATNKPLAQQVSKGEFRQDLYYRLKVLTFRVPPLRDRSGDIRVLAKYFLDHYCSKHGRVRAFSKEALNLLEKYSWPGNVRELRYFIERMVIVTKQKEISGGQLMTYWDDQDLSSSQNASASLKPVSDEEERIRQAIEQAEGNISKAARILGIDRSTIYRRMKTEQKK